MPKRKKHAARAQQRAESQITGQRLKQLEASKTSNFKQKKEPVQRHQKTSPDSSLSTLGTRFASLPAELRAEIFAWLLVRPVKWSATHTTDCPLRNPELTATPFEDIRPRALLNAIACASTSRPATRWRSHKWPVARDPWRSDWAPPITNEYLCCACWDTKFRSYPSPRVDSLPCLCARKRRADGLMALLVCKTWYEEGARVLYTRNTFAFASPGECAEFFGGLSPRWSALVSKVSLLSLAPMRDNAKSTTEELENNALDPRELHEAWTMLQKLPALSELELDALFLTCPECVRVLLGSSLRSLRKVCFTQAMPVRLSDAPREFVWPRRALRRVIYDNDYLVAVARGIKGLWYSLARVDDRDGRKADERALYRTRFTISMSLDEEYEGGQLITLVTKETVF